MPLLSCSTLASSPTLPKVRNQSCTHLLRTASNHCIIVYLDVNVARDSSSYGNIYVFKNKYKPSAQKLQKVRITTEVDVERVRDMIADAVANPSSCDDLEKVREN